MPRRRARRVSPRSGDARARRWARQRVERMMMAEVDAALAEADAVLAGRKPTANPELVRDVLRDALARHGFLPWNVSGDSTPALVINEHLDRFCAAVDAEDLQAINALALELAAQEIFLSAVTGLPLPRCLVDPAWRPSPHPFDRARDFAAQWRQHRAGQTP